MARPKFKITDGYDYYIASKYLNKHIDTWEFWSSDDWDARDAAVDALFVKIGHGMTRSKLPDLPLEPTDKECQEAYDQINSFMAEHLDAEQLRKLHLTIRQKRKGRKDSYQKDIKLSIGYETHRQLKDVAKHRGTTLKQTVSDMVELADKEVNRFNDELFLERSGLEDLTDEAILSENTQLKHTKTGLGRLLGRREHYDMLSHKDKLLVEETMQLLDSLVAKRLMTARDRKE